MIRDDPAHLGYDDDAQGRGVPLHRRAPSRHQMAPQPTRISSSPSSVPLPHGHHREADEDDGDAARQPTTMQRLLRCFSELDASLVLSVPRADLIRAIVVQYGLSETQAKTVLVEKENELKEKIGGDGFNTQVFKRNGTLVYSAERSSSNEFQGSDSSFRPSQQRQMSPPPSPAGYSLSPRSASPPESSDFGFASPRHDTRSSGRLSFSSPAAGSSNTGSFKSLSIKKHDIARELAVASSPSISSLSQSMEDILIDPISMELMKKPVMLPCGHSFSRRTITKWLEQQSKCPSCNTPATVADLQPNYALRTVVRHYKKMAKQNRAKRAGDNQKPTSSVASDGDGSKKKSKAKHKKKKKKKEKDVDQSTLLRKDLDENLSPFAFFNAWVNGKDKKAKEERQARQREEEDEDLPSSLGSDRPGPGPGSGSKPEMRPSTDDGQSTSDIAIPSSSNLPTPTILQLQPPQPSESGITLNGAWFDGFMDNISTPPAGDYSGPFAASGVLQFSTPSSLASSATVPVGALADSNQSLALMGDNLMVGYVNDEDSMGRVGFSSSLFSFDDTPRDRRPDQALPSDDEDKEESTQDDEDEEEEDDDDEEEDSSEEDDDDEAAAVQAGSWPSKSETIVIGGKDEDVDRSANAKDKAAKIQSLLARFKASASSSERSDDDGERHRQPISKDGKHDRTEPEEEEQDDLRDEPPGINSRGSADGASGTKLPKERRTRTVALNDDAEAEVEESSRGSRSKSAIPSGDEAEEEQKLKLGLDVEYQHLRYDMQHKGTLVVISVRAPPTPNSLRNISTSTPTVAGSPSRDKAAHVQGKLGSNERAQIAVIAAIDRSSSMKGQKMYLVKESLRFLISQLSPGDCMGLVSYDEEVSTEIPLTFLDDSGKESVLRAVSNIRTGLWTNLSGGLFSALQLLNKLPSNHPNMVCSILLFTDGGANRGITQTEQIVKALDTELRQLRIKSLVPTVFTFGFGSAPDANMLTKIAEMGNGLYYAIEAVEAIPAAFADCLGGLLSVCAENIRIKIESSGGVTISKIFGDQSVEEHSPYKSYSILLGDIYYEEARDILLGLTLPALEEPASSLPVLSATLTYSSLPGGRHTTISAQCSVARPAASGVASDFVASYEVDKQRNRVSTADAIKRAIAEQEGRRFDSAVAILTDAINQIQSSASASDPFCLSLVENLNECIMRTKRAKATGGGNKISFQSSLALAHSRQRSTHVRGTITYSTTAKASTTLKLQTASKSVPATPSSPPAQKAPRSHGDIKFLLANAKQLFERIRLIYALVEDQCSARSCPKMTAGPKFEYLWKDDGQYKQATPLPAPQYVGLLFQATEQIFTQGPNLHSIKDSLRRLFRVYAHIFHHHIAFFEEIGEMKLLQASFASFVRFVREHGLVDERELLPMHRHPEVK